MLKIARSAALASALLAGMSMAAEAACVGPECPPSKPLDIQKFMREQAASTRGGERKSPSRAEHRARPAAQVSKPDKPKADARKTETPKAQRTQTAKRKNGSLPAEATSSFAAQDAAAATAAPAVQVVTAEEFNAIDQAAPPSPVATAAETVGSAPREQNVPMVVADAFNEIDRKSYDSARAAVDAARLGQQPQEPAKAENSRVASFFAWIWSAIAGTFTALATAVRQLTGAAGL